MFLLQVPVDGNQGRGLSLVENEGGSIAVKEINYVSFDPQLSNFPTVYSEFCSFS